MNLYGFQSTAGFDRLSSYMVHPTKFLVSVGLAQARPNYGKQKTTSLQKVALPPNRIDMR